MKNLKFLVLLSLMLLSSCGKEQITPLYNSKTFNELQNNRPLYFSYQIDETQIDEYAKNTGKIPIFGKVFQAIAMIFANATINGQGGHEIVLDPLDVDLTSTEDIDFGQINWIKFGRLFLEIKSAHDYENLKFIDRIEIFAKVGNISNKFVDSEGYTRILYFDRALHELKCEDRCLNLIEDSVNWKELMARNKIVKIRPKITINSVPFSTLKLAGLIDFSVKFNPGF